MRILIISKILFFYFLYVKNYKHIFIINNSIECLMKRYIQKTFYVSINCSIFLRNKQPKINYTLFLYLNSIYISRKFGVQQ